LLKFKLITFSKILFIMNSSLKVIKRQLTILCFFCLTTITVAQEKNSFVIPDSLADKTYEYLFGRLRKNYKDTLSSLIYLNSALTKATIENNKQIKAISYNTLSAFEKDKGKKLKLIESAILEGEGIEDVELIPVYLNIGYVYSNYYEYEKALTYYIKALQFSEKFDIEVYTYILYTNIAKVKESIGKHDEALALYKKSLNYGNKKHPNDTIKKIINIINVSESLRNNKKYDSASYYYNSIIKIAYQKFPNYGKILTINEGINTFFKKEYVESERLLINGSSTLEIYPENQSYYILSQIYLGKIQQLQYDDIEKAKSYYLKVDSILDKTQLIIPEASIGYDFLKTYYKNKEDFKNQLDITNKYLKLKTIISSRNLKTTDLLFADFDKPQLLKNKQELIDKLENKTSLTTAYASLFIFVLILIFIIQYIRYKKQIKIYNSIIKNLNNEAAIDTARSKKTIPSTPIQKLNIDEEVIDYVLKKLKNFESKNEFLKTEINVHLLAKKCNTNTKYLSKIINTHKGKSFINYINDLRIIYILKELKENPKLERYTIKSISEEAGFNTAESFATAFKKKTGIRPSFYLKKLKNDPTIDQQS